MKRFTVIFFGDLYSADSADSALVAPPDARFAGPRGELRTFNRGKVTAAEVPARTMNQEIALARWHFIYIYIYGCG